MVLLFASLLALLVGPALIALFGQARTVAATFDGFVLVSVGGLVLLHLLPEGLALGGWAAVVAALVGLAVPFVVEGRLHRAHGALLWVALIGLAAHAITDGAALFADGHHGHDGEDGLGHLALGVILHRLPFGLFLWIAMRPAFGTARTLAVMALEGGATFVGYGLGPTALDGLTAEALAVFQTFVAGTLLHVVLHHGMPGVVDAEVDHDEHPHHHLDHPHDALHPHGHDHDAEDHAPGTPEQASAHPAAASHDAHDGHDHSHDHSHDGHAHDAPPAPPAPAPAAKPAKDHGHGHDHGHRHGHGHDHGHGHGHDRGHGHGHDRGHGHGHDHGHGHGHAHGHSHGHAHGHSHGHDHGHNHGHAHGQLAPPHVRAEKAQPRTERAFAALGALLGVGILVALSQVDAHASQRAQSVFLTLALESAPALLFAFVAAGLLQAFLDPQALGWLGRGGPLRQAARGMAFGLPLPVCSCGVLPLYTTLARAGVPAAAGLAFLVATPELGLDALLISLPLLGGEITVARLVAAAVVALGTAWLVARLVPRRTAAAATDAPAADRGSWQVRARSGLRFGLSELVDHTLPWILVGLGMAALLEPALSAESLGALPRWIAVPVLAAAGAPLYVCASGATPLVAVLLHKGVSAGAALAFLLTGPATNATTFGVLARLHGRKVAVAFALCVTGLAVGLGWGVDALLPDPTVPPLSAANADDASILSWICLALLTALLGASLLRQGPRGMVRQITRALHVHD